MSNFIKLFPEHVVSAPLFCVPRSKTVTGNPTMWYNPGLFTNLLCERLIVSNFYVLFLTADTQRAFCLPNAEPTLNWTLNLECNTCRIGTETLKARWHEGNEIILYYYTMW